MKKKLMSLALALVMCMTLCVPAFAKEAKPSDSSTPPWVDEGETWVPANDIMLMEDESCPKGHWRPDGYIYQGYTEGNTALEGFFANGIIGLMGFIPSLGAISLAVATFSTGTTLLCAAQHGGRIQGHYIKYVYTSANGRAAWYHTVWTYNEDGWGRYLDCTVTTEFFA